MRVRVTAHAAIRWLERVRGMDLTEAKAEMRQRGLNAEAHGNLLEHLKKTGRLFGISVDDEILTQFVVNAILAGAATIRLPGATLIIRDQEVVSVLTPKMNTRHGPSKEIRT